MTSPRSYRMSARAQSVAETRQRILASSLALSSERMTVDIGLVDVARRAGTSSPERGCSTPRSSSGQP
jgi:hypothetical protein